MRLFLIVLMPSYDLNKITSCRAGSCIDSPKWLKNKKTTINPKNMLTSAFNMP